MNVYKYVNNSALDLIRGDGSPVLMKVFLFVFKQFGTKSLMLSDQTIWQKHSHTKWQLIN